MKTICIYSYNMHEFIDQRTERATGGAEYQLYVLGQELKALGYHVVYLVGGLSKHTKATAAGFTFLDIFPESKRNFIFKLSHVLRILNFAKPDVILERGSSDLTFVFAIWARICRKKFIFSGASDINFVRGERDPALSSKYRKWFFDLGIHAAGSVIVQKKSQAGLLEEFFGRHGTFIPSFPHHIVENSETETLQYDVVWINNIIPYKQPEFVIELAQRLSEVRFVMIGGTRDQSYFETIRDKAKKSSNIRFIGFVPITEVGKYIRQSRILINTTKISGRFEEGFPNTFLQAWQVGVPVVSLISDPDGILERHRIGMCSRSIDQMEICLRRLLKDENLRSQMGQNAQDYVKQFHDKRKIVQLYKNVIES